MSKKTKEDSNSNRKIVVIIIPFVCAIAVLAGTVIYLLIKDGIGSVDGSEKRGTISLITDSSSTVVDDVEKGYFRCVMTTEWYFTNGQPSNIYIANEKSNTRDFYFDVYLKDTEELIYSSLVVPVGYSIENFDLDEQLENGVYDALVTYSLLDEDENVQDMVSFTVTISVR